MPVNNKATALIDLSLKIQAVVHPDRYVLTNDDHQIMKDAHDEIYRLEQAFVDRRLEDPHMQVEIAIAQAKVVEAQATRDAKIWYASLDQDHNHYSSRERIQHIDEAHKEFVTELASIIANLDCLR